MKSPKFKLILTLLAHAFSAYLASQGELDAAGILSGLTQGGYNISKDAQ